MYTHIVSISPQSWLIITLVDSNVDGKGDACHKDSCDDDTDNSSDERSGCAWAWAIGNVIDYLRINGGCYTLYIIKFKKQYYI